LPLPLSSGDFMGVMMPKLFHITALVFFSSSTSAFEKDALIEN
jgi:hypothetical protein